MRTTLFFLLALVIGCGSENSINNQNKDEEDDSGQGATPTDSQTPPRRTPPRKGEGGYIIIGAMGMKFAFVPAGRFWMGGRDGKRGKKEAVIKESFYVGVYEVTQGEWDAVMGSNPAYFSREGDGKDAVKDVKDDQLKRFPVERVSYQDALQFLKKLNENEKSEGLVYRLPTEVEWECFCRGGPTAAALYGIGNPYSFCFYLDQPTNDLSSHQANFNGERPYGNRAKKGPNLGRTCKVGSYKPNCLGIHDLHGNVAEWTSTFFEDTSIKLMRGGLWSGWGYAALASNRVLDARSNRSDQGLRLVAVPRK